MTDAEIDFNTAMRSKIGGPAPALPSEIERMLNRIDALDGSDSAEIKRTRDYLTALEMKIEARLDQLNQQPTTEDEVNESNELEDAIDTFQAMWPGADDAEAVIGTLAHEYPRFISGKYQTRRTKRLTIYLN